MTVEQAIDDLLELVRERNTTLAVFAAGYNAFHGRGIELHTAIQEDLRAGVLTPPVTTETVWGYAAERGIEIDWVPIFPIREEENHDTT